MIRPLLINMMRTARVSQWGQPPKILEVEAPTLPSSDTELVQIKVAATGLHGLVRSRAAGTHYSSKTLPHIPGVDGTGTTPDGQSVYFLTIGTGIGSYSEILNVPKSAIAPLPAGLDLVQTAGLVNPALSSWMALRTRTTSLPPNFTVLIMGVTSTSGTLAIHLARKLGAGKILGCARNVEAMSVLDLDQRITLRNPVEETDFSTLGNVDVILDYVYGPPVLHLLKSLQSKSPVQYVHIGSLAGLELNLPGSVLRSKNLTIRGSGPGSFELKAVGNELPTLLEALVGAKEHKLKTVLLKDIEGVWNEKSDERIVFLP